MASREPYTQAHDDDMMDFWETEMKDGNEIARDPCGFRLWEEYIKQGHSQRTRDSLTSHFRKQVLPRLTTWPWTAARKLELVKLWGVSVDKNMQTLLEKNCNVVLKLGTAGSLKSWTFTGPKQRRSGESSKAPQKKQSPPLRRIRPVIVEDEDVRIIDEEDEVIQPKRVKNEPAASRDGTMNELDWTREIRELKEHRRVRHSTREALGLPPITTPPHLRQEQDAMEIAGTVDGSFDREDNHENDGSVEGQAGQQILPEGQGNDIDTVTGLTEISDISQPASINSSEISQQFRSEACNAAFKRLKEVQKCIKDDLLPVFRRIERSIEVGSLSQLEYLDKLADAAQDFMLTVQAVTSPLPKLLKSPSKIRLIRLPHDNITPAHRAKTASSLWKSFAKKTPEGLYQRVREVIEEREPLFLRVSETMQQYNEKMSKLGEDLKAEVAKNVA